MKITVMNNGKTKHVRSENYNYDFDYETGYFARWGKTREDDPQVAPTAEILDMEITTKCKGPGGKLCKFCYKANTPNGHNMSLDTFKNIIDKMKPSEDQIGITQIAIGADAQCESNPDIWNMMKYCRENQVVPNITVADISDDVADNLVKYCGAVAVSRYDDKNYCYDSVKKLTDRGLKQTNIHVMISKETHQNAVECINDYLTDDRLKGLNAIVFLSLKQKGRGEGFTPLTDEEFKSLVDLAFENDVPIGFDSCSAPKFMKSIIDHEDRERLEQCAEPCESSCFSSYINSEADFFPCSFSEGHDEWKEGIHVPSCDDFSEIWNNEKVKAFRTKLLGCGRNCPLFNV